MTALYSGVIRVAMALLVVAGSASATVDILIRLDLQNSADSAAQGPGVEPEAAAADSVFASSGLDIWDTRYVTGGVDTTETYSGLTNSVTGAASPVSLQVTHGGNGSTGEDQDTSGTFGPTTGDYQYFQHGQTFTLSGLSPGIPVHLYLYESKNFTRDWRMIFTVANGATSDVTAYSSQINPANGNYLYRATTPFTVTPSGSTLTGIWDAGSQESGGRTHVAGFQLFQAGAATNNTAEPPVITGLDREGSDFVLQWSATNVGSYAVESTTSLFPVAGWSNQPGLGPVPGSNGILSVTDTNATEPQKFYRVRWSY